MDTPEQCVYFSWGVNNTKLIINRGTNMPDALQILQTAFQDSQNRTETQRTLQNLATAHPEHRDMFTRLASNQSLETLLAISGGSNIGADTFGAIAEYAGDSTSLEIDDINHLEFLGTAPVPPPGLNTGGQAISLITELGRADTPVARIGIIARLQQLRIQNPTGIPLSETQIQQLTSSLQQGNDQIFEAYRNAITAGNPEARATALAALPALLQRNTVIQQVLGIPNPVGFQPTQPQRTQLTSFLQQGNDQAFDAYRRAMVAEPGQARATVLTELSTIMERNILIQQALGTQNPVGFRPTAQHRLALNSFNEQNQQMIAEANRRLAIAAPGSQAFVTTQATLATLVQRGALIQQALGPNP